MPAQLNLDTLILETGSHRTREDGVCLIEAAAWFAGEPHTDAPACVSGLLGALGRCLNDVVPPGKRQRLIPLIPALCRTAGDGMDGTRSTLVLNWIIRTWAPAWLELGGAAGHAGALRALAPITAPAVPAAQAAVLSARDAAARLGSAALVVTRRGAGEGAGALVWETAWATARAAAMDACWDAAQDGLRSAAHEPSWAPIRGVVWDTARAAAAAAAGKAACEAAQEAGLDSAVAAAGRGAWATLSPVVSSLQDGAIDLLAGLLTLTGSSGN